MLPAWLTRFLTTLVILLLLDAVWLTAIAPTSRRVIAAIQGSPLEVRWIPALFVYLLIAAGITAFTVTPSLREAAQRGALLGLVIYGVYDLTNYATLKAYSLTYAAADIAWGTFLCGTTAVVTAWVVSAN
jgi:uncharacterized membrane protein